MSTKFLFPNSFKKPGWVLLVFSIVAGIMLSIPDVLFSLRFRFFAVCNIPVMGPAQWFGFPVLEMANTFVGVACIAGGILVGFSREKIEDEFIAGLRYSSLLWSVLLNYGILLFAFLFIYGTAFFSVMIYNMFTTLIMYVARYNYLLYKYSKFGTDEKHYQG